MNVSMNGKTPVPTVDELTEALHNHYEVILKELQKEHSAPRGLARLLIQYVNNALSFAQTFFISPAKSESASKAIEDTIKMGLLYRTNI